jgi:hypothetical protein
MLHTKRLGKIRSVPERPQLKYGTNHMRCRTMQSPRLAFSSRFPLLAVRNVRPEVVQLASVRRRVLPAHWLCRWLRCLAHSLRASQARALLRGGASFFLCANCCRSREFRNAGIGLNRQNISFRTTRKREGALKFVRSRPEGIWLIQSARSLHTPQFHSERADIHTPALIMGCALFSKVGPVSGVVFKAGGRRRRRRISTPLRTTWDRRISRDSWQ